MKINIFAIPDLKSQGTTYGACTQAGSENGAAWCATEVLRLFLSVFQQLNDYDIDHLDHLDHPG